MEKFQNIAVQKSKQPHLGLKDVVFLVCGTSINENFNFRIAQRGTDLDFGYEYEYDDDYDSLQCSDLEIDGYM